jgi:hypothetical protein
LKRARTKQKHYANQLSTPKQFNIGEKCMLNIQKFTLLNQPSNKVRSRYIDPYKIIAKISSQAKKLYLPSNIKVHIVFHIGLLKEFKSSSHGSEVPDDIPTSNDFTMVMTLFMFTLLLIV